MKFTSVLAIAFFFAAVSAAPHNRHRNNRHRGGDINSNVEDNSNREDNSKNTNKQINQGIGSVGSTSNSGALSGLLGGGINIGKSSNTNNVAQNANIS